METPAFVSNMFGSWWGLFEFSFIVIVITLLSLIGTVVVSLYFFRDEHTGLYKSTSPEGDVFTRAFLKPHTETELEMATAEDVDPINERVRRTTDDLVSLQTSLSEQDREELAERAIDRTNREIMGPNGVTPPSASSAPAPYTKISARIIGPSISDTPFTRIDFRVDQHERNSVRILFLDGSLPESVDLPVTINVTMIKKKEGGDYESIKFFPVPVSSFSNPVLVQREDGVPFDDDLSLSKQDRARIIITAADDNLTLFNSDNVILESPLPILKEIIATDDFVLMTAALPYSPFYTNVVYPGPDSEYEARYPSKTPSLTHGATTAKHSLPSVVVTTTSELIDLDKPSTLMLYGPVGTRLDKELYEEIKKNGGGETYTLVKAKVSVAPNPVKPDETFISLSPLDYDVIAEPGKVIVGWVIGFGTDRAGYNVVFPATSGRFPFTLEMKLELTDTGKEVVVHNTERAVGCFGTEEAEAEAVVTSPLVTPISELFFERFIRPVVLVRNGKIDAVVSAPLTEEGGKGTKLLPRRLTLERGFIDVDDASAEDILRLSTVEMNASLTKTPFSAASPMMAIFPSPDVIPFDENAFSGLKDAISKRSADVIKVKKVIVDAPKEDDEVVVLSSSLERVARMPYGDKSPIILKGTRDGDPVADLRVVVQPRHPGPLPFSPHREEITLEFGKIPETSEYYAEALKNGEDEPILPPPVNGSTFDAVVCRMSSPPSSLRDDSVTYHTKFQVGLKPDFDESSPPDWALTRAPGRDAPLRHIFACSVRTTPMTGNTLQEKWLGDWFENRFGSTLTPTATSVTSDDISDETSFDHFNNALYDNNDTTTGPTDHRNVPIVLSQSGDKIEKILPGKTNALYGPSGLVVFGSDACPPTDKNVKWRNAGDLTLVSPDRRGSSLPVTPISTHLQTWAGGEPVVRYQEKTKRVLRLDPRMALVANVAPSTDLLAVAYDPTTRIVKAVERTEMLWSLTDDSPVVTDNDSGLIKLDTAGSILQDLVWNRQLFKSNSLFLCVKIPSFEGVVPDSEKGSLLLNICDPVVFLVAASPEGDTSEANRSELFKSVLEDGSIAPDRVSVPLNFAVKCGFSVGNIQ